MTSELPVFRLPESFDSCGGWGPLATPDTLAFCLGPMDAYPFEPAPKQERLGRVCDFTYATVQRSQRDGRAAAQGPEEDAEFQLVDSRPVKVNRYQNRYGRRPQQVRRANIAQQQQQQQQQMAMHLLNQQGRGGPSHNVAQSQRLYQQQQAQRQQQWQRTNRLRQLAEWSIEPQHDWDLIETWQLVALPRLSLDVSKIEFRDIDWRGELRVYDKGADRILPKSRVWLADKYTQTNSFYWPGTSDDTILVNAFDNDPTVTVAATDQILACLMAAAQSRLSWHLLFHKANGKLLIDKQNGSSIDLLTVDETSKDPPLSDHPVKINRPADLGAEALKINQNFSQQVLNHKTPPVKAFPNAPFVEERDAPASRVYRYRIVTLPPMYGTFQQDPTGFSRRPVSLVVRAEIDAVLPGTTDNYVTIRALNEFNPSRTGQSWVRQLETHHGALIAQESKNNHCKVGKWVSQAMIAGSENLKIGFVSRANPESNQRHIILNVQSYKVKELGIQIGMQEENVWGIVRSIIDLVMAQPDGHYTLIKDPVKPEIKLYRVGAVEETVEDPKETSDGAESRPT